MLDPILEAGYRYSEVEARGHQLELLLKEYGIIVRQGGALEQAILTVNDVVYRHIAGGATPPKADALDTYASLIGLNELSTLLLAVRDHPDFEQVVPHLRLLNEGAALQNTRSLQTDSATNKVFELFTATLAMQLGSDIRVDGPERSDGRNPDVLATIGGRRWGIACKVLHSKHSEGFVQHLEKGVDQIEVSDAEVGVVFFNLKNILDREAIWPASNTQRTAGEPPQRIAFARFEQPLEILLHQVQGLGRDLKEYLPTDYLPEVFSGKKAVPGILLWAHATSGVMISDRPTVSSVRVMNFLEISRVSTDIRTTWEAFNWAAFPDSPSRGPRPAI